MVSAPLIEVFCSAQGEGPLVGVRQLFVRFAECNLACTYCDTPLGVRENCRVERTPGSGRYELLPNPVEARSIGEIARSFGRVHSIALTGGEPLLYPEFIRGIETEIPLYLESNMSLPEAAAELRDRVRYVAGDFKLREAVGEAYEELRDRAVRCFRVLRSSGRRYTFCKLVLPERFDEDELVSAVDELRGFVSMVVLQPVWGVRHAPRELLRVQERLLELVDTRIIPQTHKLLGLR